MKGISIALILAAAGAAPAVAETTYWVPWNFAGEPCRQSTETPEQFAARRRAALNAGEADQVHIVVRHENDGTPVFDVIDRGQTFTFWTDHTSCWTDHYKGQAQADAYR